MKKQLFRHYKGGVYELIGHARDTDLLETYVIYRGVGDTHMWARPAREFYGQVDSGPWGDHPGDRFVPIEEENE